VSERTTTWDGKTVRLYDWPEDVEKWEFPDDHFPWLCDTSSGLDFVVTDWRITEAGDWGSIQVGISLDDLIDSFLDFAADSEKKDRHGRAVAALTRAIERLKTP
jgi:hypothetical protein